MGFNQISDILNQHGEFILLAVFFIAFIEAVFVVGLVIPGAGLLFTLSASAATGQTSLTWLILAAMAGAIIGDGMSFLLGRHFHQPFLNHRWVKKHQSIVERGEDFFNKHGTMSIVLGRFIGPIRPIIPFIAGMFHFPQKLFFIVNVSSAFLWALWYCLPGYLTAKALGINSLEELLAPLYTQEFAIILLFSTAIFAIFIILQKVGSRLIKSDLNQTQSWRLYLIASLVITAVLYLGNNQQTNLDSSQWLGIFTPKIGFGLWLLPIFSAFLMFGLQNKRLSWPVILGLANLSLTYFQPAMGLLISAILLMSVTQFKSMAWSTILYLCWWLIAHQMLDYFTCILILIWTTTIIKWCNNQQESAKFDHNQSFWLLIGYALLSIGMY